MAETADSDDQELAISFGRCVVRHRDAAGLPMSKLAQMAGMSRAYLWRVEQGMSLPSLRNVARIAVALEVPLSSLVEGIDLSSVSLENRSYTKGPQSEG